MAQVSAAGAMHGADRQSRRDKRHSEARQARKTAQLGPAGALNGTAGAIDGTARHSRRERTRGVTGKLCSGLQRQHFGRVIGRGRGIWPRFYR